MFKMIKYYFVCPDGEIFVNLPSCVSDKSLISLMRDLNASRVYVLSYDVKIFKDF